MKYIIRAIKWVLCLGLRCTAWCSNRLHQKLNSGPQARLWAASDAEIMVEARRRGLMKRKKKSHSKNVVALQRPIELVPASEVQEASLAVSKLQNINSKMALELVKKAVCEFKTKPTVQEIVIATLKYA